MEIINELGFDQTTTTQNVQRQFASEITEVNANNRSFVGYINTGSLDRYGTIITPEGVNLEHYRKNPVVFWNHRTNDLPIGKNEWIKVERNGILAKTNFASHALAQDVWNLYTEGFINALSMGFIVNKYKINKDDTITLNETELLEYSVVGVPGNRDALIKAHQRNFIKSSQIRELFESQLDVYSQRDKIDSIEEKLELLNDSLKRFVIAEDYQKKINELVEEVKTIQNEKESLVRYFKEIQTKEKKQRKELFIENILNRVAGDR